MTISLSETELPLVDPVLDDSVDFIQNPYPLFEQYRHRSPVAWSQRGNQWIVTGFEEGYQLLRDQNFGKKIERWKHPNLLMRYLIGFLRSRNTGSMLLLDAPEHTRVRGLIQQAFLPSIMRALEPHITEIMERLTADIKPGDSGDLIAQVAYPLPVTVIAELLGIPSQDHEQFRQWSKSITSSIKGVVCPFQALKSYNSSLELRKYLRTVVNNKRSQPANDLLSQLVMQQQQESTRLTESELLANSMLILIAGHETTVNLIGNGIYQLLKHPSQKKLLLENPNLIDSAINEFLRFDPPVQMVRRIAYQETELGGKKIMPSDALTVLIGACNRDPRIIDEPNVFDISRSKIKQLSFGAGIHYCVGAELAKIETATAVSMILKKFPNLSLQSPKMTYRAPFALRGLQELLVHY